ncbi:MAG TPA: hypothetical protein VFI68_02720, partial [Anaerolineales bacterium]|nr:hypothetical protein [Anaerolineales bacterium]
MHHEYCSRNFYQGNLRYCLLSLFVYYNCPQPKPNPGAQIRQSVRQPKQTRPVRFVTFSYLYLR